YYAQALVIDRRRGDAAGESKTLNNLGTVYMGLARYDLALAHFEAAVALARRADQPRSVASAIGNLGAVHNARGNYREAIARYSEALAIETRLGIKEMMAISLSNLGEAHSSLDHDEEALAYYERSLAIERVLNRPGQIASTLNNLGTVHQSRGRYDLAIAAFEEALAIDRKLGRAGQTAVRLSNIGYQYRLWGRLDQALQYFDEALALDRSAGREAQAAVDLSHKGRTFAELGRFDEAVACHAEALAIFRKLSAVDHTATALSDLASVHHLRGDLDRATALFTEALALDRHLGREADVAVGLSNLASLASDRNDWPTARRLATEALAIERRLGKTPAVAITLSQLGVIAWRLKAPTQAIAYLEESVTLLDRLRLTAKGELRRDYLARTLNAYQQLVEAHALAGQAESALTASERSRAKLLAELLTGRDEAAVPTLAAVRASLPVDTAAIVFANASRPHLVQLAVTREGVAAVTTATTSLVATASAATAGPADRSGRRGVALEVENGPEAAPQALEATVSAYRAALVRQDAPQARRLGRTLYDALIGPLEARLAGKTRLVIVPDGVLGLVPIEALIDPQGRYVAERFEVTYAHSLAVRQLLAGRQHPADRQPLLAFGGARYEAGPAAATATSDVAARREARLALARGGSAAEAYGQLGLGSWAELPGTLTEVKAIAKAVPQARVVSGEAVTEAGIKAMAARGELGRYRVLHFATHGLAVPQLPELSALVLSQLPTQPGGEDGYLRAGEVASLPLRADFVNLSACETGLGKVYGGEGVVGLAQSFLVAGANGLSMSLWSVADASTATFMTELYKTAATDRVGYAEAASRVKRRFVTGEFGEAYRQPYYWAPFVHYGR
ncbi:MAG: CHAT domain-containing tetratricopeptide repeat protein, partial [Candidatus Sericytochromatia bacterium]